MRGDIYTVLSDISDVEAVYGGGRVPHGATPPYLHYFGVSNNRVLSHSGFTGLQRYRVQVSVYAESYEGAVDLANDVIEAMEEADEGGIAHVRHEDDHDIYDHDVGLYHIPIDFMVDHIAAEE